MYLRQSRRYFFYRFLLSLSCFYDFVFCLLLKFGFFDYLHYLRKMQGMYLCNNVVKNQIENNK